MLTTAQHSWDLRYQADRWLSRSARPGDITHRFSLKAGITAAAKRSNDCSILL